MIRGTPYAHPPHYSQRTITSLAPTTPNTTTEPLEPSTSFQSTIPSKDIGRYATAAPFAATPDVSFHLPYAYPQFYPVPSMPTSVMMSTTTTMVSPPLADVDISPSTAWSDTPRTLYKSSPMTDAGDWDVAGSDDEGDADGLVVRRTTGTALSLPSLSTSGGLWVPQRSSGAHNTTPFTLGGQAAMTAGDLDRVMHNAGVDERAFASRLQEDIKTAALFPPVMHVPNPVPTASPAASPLTSSTSSRPIPNRKPSLHLTKPSTPIDLYAPSSTSPIPFTQTHKPYELPEDHWIHVRRYLEGQKPLLTVCMSDLIKPNASYEVAVHPAEAAEQALAPTPKMVEGVDPDLPFGMEAYTIKEEDHEEPLKEEVTSPATTAKPSRKRVRQDAEASEDEDAYGDSDAEGEDEDDSYEFRAASRPLTKRARVRRSSATTATSPASPRYVPSNLPSSPVQSRRGPQPGSGAGVKPRTRHLQPNLSRPNGCMHGCPVTFSTPYEARRHQEDQHAREEAFAVRAVLKDSDTSPLDLTSQSTLTHAATSNGGVRVKSIRFLLHVGHSHNQQQGGSNWDSRTKDAFVRLLKDVESHEDDEDEEGAESVVVGEKLIAPLVEFARSWCERYKCKGCGLGFSRLDSKKRHWEKGCVSRR